MLPRVCAVGLAEAGAQAEIGADLPTTASSTTAARARDKGPAVRELDGSGHKP